MVVEILPQLSNVRRPTSHHERAHAPLALGGTAGWPGLHSGDAYLKDVATVAFCDAQSTQFSFPCLPLFCPAIGLFINQW
ncbi:hypothetical protein ACRRTK_014627 [Alexandromys fortis]